MQEKNNFMTVSWILIQFKDKGRIITYLPEYSDYTGLGVYAIFKVKIKDKRTRLQKIFLNWKYKKYWNRHVVGSQIHIL
jgi:hypothetical protein